MFALCRAGQYVHAEGVRRRLQSVYAESLDAELHASLGGEGARAGPPVVVGALPFDAREPAFLYQPERFRRGVGLGPLAGAPGDEAACSWAPFQIVAEPSAAHYAAMVRQALERISRGELSKVVLSRKLHIEAARPVDPLEVARRLARDSHVTAFMMALPARGWGAPAALVGATPELLVRRQGNRVTSHPLAGSAPRRHDRSDDEAMAHALLRSDKDQREHALVVEAILDCLTPYCATLGTPDGTALQATATMWHLGTRIEGTLKSDAPSAAGLAALLHPTPAVGGSPRRAALDAIHAIEPDGRGFYAGAIGWVDARGDGEWHVTLRCAEIRGTRLTLQAGAGIVAGSNPEGEVAETGAKFRAMLRAIEMDEVEQVMETTP